MWPAVLPRRLASLPVLPLSQSDSSVSCPVSRLLRLPVLLEEPEAALCIPLCRLCMTEEGSVLGFV